MGVALAQPDDTPPAAQPPKGIVTPTDVRLGPWPKDPVNVRLRGIRWRQRFFNLLTLLLGVLAAMLIYIVVMMCADRLGEFETSTRQIFLGTAAMMLGITAFLMSLYFLFGKFNPMLHAREIDRALGNNDDSLVTYIDLRRRTDIRPGDIDVAEMLQDVALERVQRIDADQVIDAKPLARTLKVLGGTAAFMLLLFLFWGRTFGDSFHRVVMPWKSIAPPRWTQIVDIVPGNNTAVAGEPVRFAGIVRTNGVPDGVTLRYKVEGEARGASEPLLRLKTETNGVQFGKDLPGFPRAVTYWLESGDAKAGPFRLEITPRPLIAAVNVKVHPPAYAPFAPVREAAGGHVQAVAGSRLEITATATHPVKSAPANGESLTAWLDINNRKTAMMIDGSTLTANVLLSRDFEYRIGFIDTRNLTSRDGVQYQAKLVPDAPPSAALSREDAADGTPAPHNGRITLRAEGSDDLGLAKISLRLNILGGLDGSPLRTLDHAPLRPPRDFKHTFEVNLEELHLREGDTLDCVLFVEDVLKPKAQSFATPPVRVPIVRGEQRTRQIGVETEAVAGIEDRSLTRPENAAAVPSARSSDQELSAEEERLISELAELVKARQDAANKEKRALTAQEMEKFADQLAKLAEESEATAANDPKEGSKDSASKSSRESNSGGKDSSAAGDKNSSSKAGDKNGDPSSGQKGEQSSKGGESGNKNESGKNDAGKSESPGANKSGSDGNNKSESGNRGASNGSGNREGNGSGDNASKGGSSGKNGNNPGGKNSSGSGNSSGESGTGESGSNAQSSGATAGAGGGNSNSTGSGSAPGARTGNQRMPGSAQEAQKDVTDAAQQLRDGKADDRTLDKTKSAFDYLFRNSRNLSNADREKLRAAAEGLPDNPTSAKRRTVESNDKSPKGRARNELTGGKSSNTLINRTGDMKEDELGRTLERGSAKIAPEYRKALEDYYKSLNK